jgi:hypothetical protein
MEYGDRQGNCVYVKSPYSDSGFWIDVTTGKPISNSNPQSQDFTTEKARFIRFVRYLRPRVVAPFDHNWRGGFHMEIDNMRGTTFIIELDYTKKSIAFAYSVCRGDNFEKRVGKNIAKQRFMKNAYEIPMKTSLNTGEYTVNENGVLCDIFDAIFNSPACSERTKMLKEFHDAGF